MSEPPLKYKEGKKKSQVMASLEYTIISVVGVWQSSGGEAENECDITEEKNF